MPLLSLGGAPVRPPLNTPLEVVRSTTVKRFMVHFELLKGDRKSAINQPLMLGICVTTGMLN